MKFLRSLVAFFADDLLTAGFVIVWVVAAALAARAFHPDAVGSLVYLIGIVVILAFGAWKRARSK